MGKADLDGSQAVARLEQRGGQVWVFWEGHGKKGTYGYGGREGGATIVLGPKSTDAHPDSQGRRWVLRNDLERESLAREMESARDRLNASAGGRYILLHRDVLDTDAGYAQIGCGVTFVSVVVGLIIGLIGAWIATGEDTLTASIAGIVIGSVVGFFGAEPVASAAVRIPPLRDRIDNLAFCWWLVAPGAITALTILSASLMGF